MMVSKPAVFYLVFSLRNRPLGSNGTAAYVRAVEQWWEALPLRRPLADFEVPSRFPGDLAEGGSGLWLRAAKGPDYAQAMVQRAGAEYALAYQYADLLTCVYCRSRRDAFRGQNPWRELAAETQSHVSRQDLTQTLDSPDGMLGDVRIFQALVNAPAEQLPGLMAEAARYVRTILGKEFYGDALAADELSRNEVLLTEQGICAARVSEARGRPVYVMLTTADAEETFDRFIAWNDDQVPPLGARYLAQVAKSHYLSLQRDILFPKLQREIEALAGYWQQLVREAPRQDPASQDAFHEEFDNCRADQAYWLREFAILQSHLTTTQIALANLPRLQARIPVADASGDASFLVRDMQHCVLLEKQLQADVAYLETLRRSARNLESVATSTIDWQEQRNERQENTVRYWETSLMSLLVGVFALGQCVGAIGPTESKERLHWFVYLLPLTLTFSLVPVVIRGWLRGFSPVATWFGVFIGASIGWVLAVLSIGLPNSTLDFTTIGAASLLGGAAAWGGVAWRERWISTR